MKKISIEELADYCSILENKELMNYVGGGDGSTTNPYTWEEYKQMGYAFTNGWVDTSELYGTEAKSYFTTPYEPAPGELMYGYDYYGYEYGYTYDDDPSGNTPNDSSYTARHTSGYGTGTASDPYTIARMEQLYRSNCWHGGYVEGLGYVSEHNPQYYGADKRLSHNDCTQFTIGLRTYHDYLTGNLKDDINQDVINRMNGYLGKMVDVMGTSAVRLQNKMISDALGQGYTRDALLNIVKVEDGYPGDHKNTQIFVMYDACTGRPITSYSYNYITGVATRNDR